MNVKIRKGTMNDVEELSSLYDRLNDYLEAHNNYPGWKKGVYPIEEDAVTGIEEDNLFVAELDGVIVGSFILRHKPEEAYAQATWKKDLPYDKVFVIYTFVTNPDYIHQGIGSKMLDFAADYGKKQGVESLRLDVFDSNLPAIHTYEKNHFEYIQTVDLGLEEYGLKWFRLYERILL